MARQRRKLNTAPPPEALTPGAALAKMRRKYDHVCEWEPCGKEFRGIDVAKFCSNACRQANKYSKVKAAREDAKPADDKTTANKSVEKIADGSTSPTKRTRKRLRRRRVA